MARKNGTNGTGSKRDLGVAADALVIEAIARREQATREATMNHLLAGNYGAALTTFGRGLMEAAELDDGQPRDYRRALAQATAKTVELGGQA